MKRLVKRSEKIYLKDILKPWEDASMVYDTDYYNRDNAFVIYNDKLYEANTHEQALRKAGHSWSDNDHSTIFGSVLTGTDGKKYVAIYESSAENMTLQEAVPILKNKYPSAIICTDPMNDIDETAYLDRVAKIIKASKIYLKDILDPNNIKSYGENTDYGNRDFAISYIDDRVYKGETHKDTVEAYLQQQGKDPVDYLNYNEGFVTPEEQEEVDTPMGFASYVKGIDGKDYIAIYPNSLMFLSMGTFVRAVRQEFPNAIICEDDNDRYMETKNAYIETI